MLREEKYHPPLINPRRPTTIKRPYETCALPTIQGNLDGNAFRRHAHKLAARMLDGNVAL